MRVSRKEPLDILYLTPSITWIYKMEDKFFSLSPEILYIRIRNLELRLRASVLKGELDT